MIALFTLAQGLVGQLALLFPAGGGLQEGFEGLGQLVQLQGLALDRAREGQGRALTPENDSDDYDDGAWM